jgi:zinc transport system substrate-binding protein
MRLTALPLILVAAPALAEAPVVVVDTAPLHSLVAQVMAGVGEPALLLAPGASPHDFQLRPSDAAALDAADLVIWTGPALAPWMEAPLESLAGSATRLELLEAEGWTRLPFRTDAAFAAAHEHAHEHAEEGHDHAEEGHDHGDEAHDHDHDHGHDHGSDDPHAWLDPAVAAVWLDLIAAALAEADPANAATYAANATASQDEVSALTAEIAETLAPVAGRPFIVPHDAYQYFEVAFGMPAAGAISLSDASQPGPQRIADLQALVAAGEVRCILTDPQTSPDWVAVLAEGSIARTAQADPDGQLLPAGPALYGQVMRGIADALASCLAD